MSDTPNFALTGKVIVLCGGTGLLGRALLSALAASGAHVIATSRQPAQLEPLIARAREDGLRATAVALDITDEPAVLALRDRLLAEHGRVDGFVFNAVSRPMKAMHDPLPAWQESLATNASGFFAVVRAFGDAMAAQGSGSIVNISSIQGQVGSQPWLYEGTSMTIPPDYFFHKAGMINLTRYLASHYGLRNVRVNAVSPGGIYNPERPQAEAFRARYEKLTMLNRMATASEITGPVVFLLSDAAAYVTGANLTVDGGYTAK